jgi:3-dehydroquinate synthase
MDPMQIRSSLGFYAVTESASLRDALHAAVASAGRDCQAVFCLVDSEVARLYPDAFNKDVPSHRVCRIQADERRKSIDALQDVILWLLDSGMRRNQLLLVVGGGVVQDIGCFIASVLFRGVTWDFIPTTRPPCWRNATVASAARVRSTSGRTRTRSAPSTRRDKSTLSARS